MGFVERVARALSIPPDTLARMAGTIAVLVLWLLAARLGRRVVGRAVEGSAARFQMTRLIGYLVGGLALFVIARLWIQGIAGVATYLGLVSAGVAIALQAPLTNIVGWLFILSRRPFRVGDRIQVGAQIGDVVDIRPLRFVMLEVGNWVHADQGTGRTLHVPNGLVFRESIANYDEAFGYIWNELVLTITFESDWRTAKKTLEKILERRASEIDEEVRRRVDAAAHILHIKFPKVTPIVWTTVVENGVRLTMRYLCKPRARRSSASEIWEEVLDAFAGLSNVGFAYPTTRRFDNMSEGKPDARAEPRAHIPPAAARD